MDSENQIKAFQAFFESDMLDYVHGQDRIGAGYIEVDFMQLAEANMELSEDLINNPEQTIKAAELALNEMDLNHQDIKVHIKNVTSACHARIREKRVANLGCLIHFEGIIRDKTKLLFRAKVIRFECPSCGNIIPVLQQDEKKTEPTRCGCGRKGKFRETQRDRVDFQRMQLEELPENMGGNGQPSTLKVRLEDTLVSVYNEPRFNPGSRVRLVGYLKERPIRLKSGAESAESDYEFWALHIENIDEKKVDVDVDDQDEQTIREISQRDDCVKYLIDCSFPHIYGYTEIKKGLLLQVVGGVAKRHNGNHLRGDIHALLIGDPGTAKSKLLSTMNNIVPSARKGSGKGASGVGLTGSVVKDEYLGTFSVRAGVLPLANGSIAIVDELDKMNKEDRDHMHEALEDQQIPITKASVQATLRSECSLLAAANPKNHRFSPYDPIVEQIDLPATLINRFDLIFPIRDVQDTESDRQKFEHVAEMHRQEESESIQSEVGEELLRKYLFRARKMKPWITNEAKNAVVDYVCDIRERAASDGSIARVPINARQVDGIIRLSEAFAKLRLSQSVQLRDAHEAIELTQWFMRQIAYDEKTGSYDADKIESGMSGSEWKTYYQIKKLVQEHAKTYKEKMIPYDKLLEITQQENIKDEDVEKITQRMKKDGDLVEAKQGYIQLI